jgi:hypothetical protein
LSPWPSDINCSLVIIGEEDEVVRAAAEHAASVHGHDDTPELRRQLREFLSRQRFIPLRRAQRNRFPDSRPIARMLARSRARRVAAQGGPSRFGEPRYRIINSPGVA